MFRLINAFLVCSNRFIPKVMGSDGSQVPALMPTTEVSTVFWVSSLLAEDLAGLNADMTQSKMPVLPQLLNTMYRAFNGWWSTSAGL